MNTNRNRNEGTGEAVKNKAVVVGKAVSHVAGFSLPAIAAVCLSMLPACQSRESPAPPKTAVAEHETRPAASPDHPPNADAGEAPVLAIQFPNEDFNASIVQLLARRKHYHGRKVQVSGFLVVEFEGTAIYLSKEDAEYGITRNGFWVSFDKTAIPYEGMVGPVEFDRKYVLIEGTFDKDSMGHMSLWQGSIEDVDRVVEKEKRGPRRD